MKLSKPEREILRMMFGGRCAYCGCELPAKGWHADHVEPVVRFWKYGEMVTAEDGSVSYNRFAKKVHRLERPDNDHADNLWPCCRLCNINKSSMPLERWRKFLMDGPESLASYNGRFRHMVRFGVVAVNPLPLMFWFERYATEQPTQPSAEKAGTE